MIVKIVFRYLKVYRLAKNDMAELLVLHSCIYIYIYVMHDYFSKLLRKKNYCKTEDKIHALNKNDWKVRFGKTVN